MDNESIRSIQVIEDVDYLLVKGDIERCKLYVYVGDPARGIIRENPGIKLNLTPQKMIYDVTDMDEQFKFLNSALIHTVTVSKVISSSEQPKKKKDAKSTKALKAVKPNKNAKAKVNKAPAPLVVTLVDATSTEYTQLAPKEMKSLGNRFFTIQNVGEEYKIIPIYFKLFGAMTNLYAEVDENTITKEVYEKIANSTISLEQTESGLYKIKADYVPSKMMHL